MCTHTCTLVICARPFSNLAMSAATVHLRQVLSPFPDNEICYELTMAEDNPHTTRHKNFFTVASVTKTFFTVASVF